MATRLSGKKRAQRNQVLSAKLDGIKLRDMDRKINRRIFILFARYTLLFFILFLCCIHHPPIASNSLFLFLFFAREHTYTYANFLSHTHSQARHTQISFLRIRVVSGCFAMAMHVVARAHRREQIITGFPLCTASPSRISDNYMVTDSKREAAKV